MGVGDARLASGSNVGRLTHQLRGARLELARVVRVAAPAHLHQQRVEAVVAARS